MNSPNISLSFFDDDVCLRGVSKKQDSPFSVLEKLRETFPPAPPSGVEEKAKPAGPARAVVRLERKHRGGKEVTVVEKLGLAEAELSKWCRELKQALGCGGSVENDAIILQGDLRTRLPALLTTRGVGKVTVSG